VKANFDAKTAKVERLEKEIDALTERKLQLTKDTNALHSPALQAVQTIRVALAE
jgi:hypothetical protein